LPTDRVIIEEINRAERYVKILQRAKSLNSARLITAGLCGA